MKSFLSFASMAAFALLIFGGMLLATPSDAQAKRFGMGSSFGKSFSKPAPRSGFSQKAAPSKQATGKTAPARGGMMGMLGGLALGGLLGAMFFGGAFEGINFFDILIIGVIAFMIISFMRRKAQASSQQYAYAAGQPQQPHADAFMQGEAAQQASAGQAIRPDIDETHFTQASKDIFLRMQTSWDKKNIEDIRSFCSTEIADRVAADLQALGDKQTHTEVGMLEAAIIDSWIEASDEWVAVQFTALLDEETRDATGQVLEKDAQQVSEIWIFRHPQHSDDPTWYLSGIQQA